MLLTSIAVLLLTKIATILKNLLCLKFLLNSLILWEEQALETHSSVLTWRIPGTGEPGGLSSMGSHRVGHDWCDLAAFSGSYRKCCDRVCKGGHLNHMYALFSHEDLAGLCLQQGRWVQGTVSCGSGDLGKVLFRDSNHMYTFDCGGWVPEGTGHNRGREVN